MWLKKRTWIFILIVFLSLGLLGCQATKKKVKKVTKSVEKADEWMKENLW